MLLFDDSVVKLAWFVVVLSSRAVAASRREGGREGEAGGEGARVLGLGASLSRLLACL